MSLHISAKPDDIAETVLLPGDPLRARYIAETFFENPVQYNDLRSMFGFTGVYKGLRISVQGTGMGIPSLSIYVHELIKEYGARRLIRVGSCGAIQKSLKLRSIILALSASSDASLMDIYFNGKGYAPTASFSLLNKIFMAAQTSGIDCEVGSILTTDCFYYEDPDFWKLWSTFGVLAVEMESAALYTLAAKHNVRAASILTVSDHLITGEKVPPRQREKTFDEMIKLALEAVVDQ